MKYQKTTQIPNELFDIQLTILSFSELKILLYIMRQTYGWITKNGKRKERDRITHGQFNTKTGLSRRIISQTIQSLILKQLIRVTDYQGTLLHTPEGRKGRISIYYSPMQTCADESINICKNKHQRMHNRVYNKTNNTKLKRQKNLSTQTRMSDGQRLQELLNSSENNKKLFS